MTPFTQEDFACRCEWGPDAVTALAPADVIIVVDVFSFTTCVDVAVSRGVAILPYAWNDPSAAELRHRAGRGAGGEAEEDAILARARVVPGRASRAAVRAALAERRTGDAGGSGERGSRARGMPAQRSRGRGGCRARRPDLQRDSSRRAMAGWRTAARARGRARRRGNPCRAARVAVAGSRRPWSRSSRARRDALVETLDACGSGRELTGRGHLQRQADCRRPRRQQLCASIRRDGLRRGMNQH